MKQVLMVLIASLLVSCSQPSQERATSDSTLDAENFDWLLGKWKRMNEEEGKETFEIWNKVSETEYSGIGFTMQLGDTVKQESIRFVKQNDRWDLLVKTPDETEETVFRGVSHDENMFECENREIEFPNKIKYWNSGDTMHASVSSNDFEIQFDFEKLN